MVEEDTGFKTLPVTYWFLRYMIDLSLNLFYFVSFKSRCSLFVNLYTLKTMKTVQFVKSLASDRDRTFFSLQSELLLVNFLTIFKVFR